MKRIVLACVILASCAPLFAAADTGFADYLFGRGDYYRAIGEYEKVLYVTGGKGKEAGRALYRIGVCYLLGEKWDRAMETFTELSEAGLGVAQADISLGEAYALQKKGDLARSGAVIESAIGTADGRQQDALLYLAGWNHVYGFELDKAEAAFAKCEGEFKPGASQALRYLQAGKPEEKSVALSMVLAAVLPGSGHAYCGKYGEAISTLLVNAFLIYKTVEAARAGDTGEITTFGVPAAVAYGLNIFGSLNTATRFNRNARNEYLAGLENLRMEVIKTDF